MKTGKEHQIKHAASGFPSQADDYLEGHLDLNDFLIKHPSATFLARAMGQTMRAAGIYEGDLLIIDRSLKPQHKDIVIAVINGELCCRYLDIHNRQLISPNPRQRPISCLQDESAIIEGVVIHSIRHHRHSKTP